MAGEPTAFERAAAASAAALRDLLAAETVTFRPRSVLARGDDERPPLYLLRDGWTVRRLPLANDRTIITDVYVPGDIVGVEYLLRRDTANGEIAALTACTCGRASGDGLLSRILGDGSMAAVPLLIADELRRRAERLACIVGWCSAEERIAAFLLDLYARLSRQKLVERGRFRLPMTQKQVGDHLGLTAVHVNRVLRQLRLQEIAHVGDGLASVMDLGRLRRLVGHLPG